MSEPAACDHVWTRLYLEDHDAYCERCLVIGVPCDECDAAGYWEDYAPDDRGDLHECKKCGGTGTAAYSPTCFHSHSPFARQRT